MADEETDVDEEPTITSLAELAGLVGRREPLFLRYSEGYETDAGRRSLDGESGLELPGLSTNPLTPEAWWTRPIEEWLARQICQYRHLGDDPGRHAWVLTGRVVARGPDCEPLVADPEPLGRLSPAVLEEAEALYRQAFDPAELPSR